MTRARQTRQTCDSAGNIAGPGSQNRTHRRPQFTLRTLLVLVVLVSIACAWFGKEVNRAHQQQRTVGELQKAGGIVQYDYQWSEATERFDPFVGPPTPVWFRRIFGEHVLVSVIRVTLVNRDFDDEDLARLSTFSDLQILTVSGTGLTDAGLAHLAKMKNLRKLDLSRTGITDAGLRHLTGLTRLQTLSLENTQITHAGLTHLMALPSIRFLDLANTNVTPAGMANLRRRLPNTVVSNVPLFWEENSKPAQASGIPGTQHRIDKLARKV